MTISLFPKSKTDQNIDDLAAQLREANKAIIELQTTVRRQHEDLRDMGRDVTIAREQAAIVAAANTAQREALAVQRRLIDDLQKEITGMRVELETTSKFAHGLQEENAQLRNDVVFWYVIANEFKKELESLGVVKPVIEHNSFKC